MASARRRVPNTGEIGLERLLRQAQDRARGGPEPLLPWWRRQRAMTVREFADAIGWLAISIGVMSMGLATLALAIALLRG